MDRKHWRLPGWHELICFINGCDRCSHCQKICSLDFLHLNSQLYGKMCVGEQWRSSAPPPPQTFYLDQSVILNTWKKWFPVNTIDYYKLKWWEVLEIWLIWTSSSLWVHNWRTRLTKLIQPLINWSSFTGLEYPCVCSSNVKKERHQ